MNTRRQAAFAVARWIATHAHPAEFLPEGGERAFVQDLVFTTVRRFRPLRAVLGRLVERWPRGEMEALLLVGAAQILYMPDVPDFAAVSETVEAAKACPNPSIARVVNAVLRNLLRRRDEFDEYLRTAPLAERESYPNGLVARWVARYGAENAERLAVHHNAPAEMFLAYPDGRFEKLARGRRVADEPGYADGDFIVQDPATAIAVELLDMKPGVSALDYCAAPGGKTVQMAWRMAGGEGGRLVACEVNPKRLVRLRENLARCRLQWVEVLQCEPEGTFDRVLVDAPCSNTGVLRRRPDARWNWTSERIVELAALQLEILSAAAAHVAPGGTLVYSTCSNEPEENGGTVERFLAGHGEFAETARRESLPFETGHDGAFACAMRRHGGV